MKKVFLYLYLIKEYTSMFIFSNDKLYDEWNVKRPLPILNECFQKRYRDNGYQVVYALYPDKNIFGIIPQEEDKIIYTDILFSENSVIDDNGKIKKDFIPKYPNEQLLISQLGDIDQLVIGGYHFADCVKRMGEAALNMGINTIVDLDLTDLFFSLYRQEDYFNINEYNPEKFKEHIIRSRIKEEIEFDDEEQALKQFSLTYSSPAFGFSTEKLRTHK